MIYRSKNYYLFVRQSGLRINRSKNLGSKIFYAGIHHQSNSCEASLSNQDISQIPHTPVLLDQVVENFLQIQSTSTQLTLVDCTIGAGGHSIELLNAFGAVGQSIRLVGIDQDVDALEIAGKRLKNEINDGIHEYTLLHGNFSDLQDLLTKTGVKCADGVLADLGVSSMQLDNGKRGFSFRKSARLDMRMNQKQDCSAYSIVNEFPEEVLGNLFRTYGEIKTSRKMASCIASARSKKPIETTDELVKVISPALAWRKGKRTSHHPAALPFQAIRMAVNDELKCLHELLNTIPFILNSRGLFAILSFHSLEDRMVKNSFKDSVYFDVPKKSLLRATDDQIKLNARCRSAKLRLAWRNDVHII